MYFGHTLYLHSVLLNFLQFYSFQNSLSFYYGTTEDINIKLI